MFFSRKPKLNPVVVEDDEGFFNIALPVASTTPTKGWHRFVLRGDHQGHPIAATLLIRDDLQSNDAWFDDSDNPELDMCLGKDAVELPNHARTTPPASRMR